MMVSIHVDGWKRNIRFSAAHCIIGHDTCGRLHGHTYAVSATITGTPQPDGMVMDFSDVTKVLKAIVDDLDHYLLIPQHHENVTVDKDSVRFTSQGKQYLIPKQDCTLLPLEQITAEHLAAYILKQVQAKLTLPSTINTLEIHVDEGFGYVAAAAATFP